MELYLLVTTNESSAGRSLIVDGQQLQLIGPYPTDNKDAIPPYACVSYVWAANRVDNPLFPTNLMSDQTLPALRALMRATASEISAFWVDAFCIPYHQPARGLTLESMGYIYSAADRVVAALGPEQCEALLEMTKCDWLSEELLTSFESNGWIASVWTYQEVVNAQNHFITSMVPHAPTLDRETFLNRIGYSLHRYTALRDFSRFNLRNVLPNLDAFDDLGGDYMTYDAFQRPMLQIMFMLDRRVAREERNKYYSMIGALTAESTKREDPAGQSLASLRKKVMSICEEKGDWSFLYSSTVRDKTEPWMPSSGHELRSILPFFVQGSGQSGRREESKVWLDKVHVVRNVLEGEGEVNVAAVKEIISELPLHVEIDVNLSLDKLKEQVRRILVSEGFTGSGEEIVLPCGIFYPQHHVPVGVDADVIICTELRWMMFGRPGLLVARGEESTTCLPGVLVGETGMGLEVEEYMLGSTEMEDANDHENSRAELEHSLHRTHA